MFNNKMSIIWIILIVVAVLLIIFWIKHCKRFTFDSVVMINGAPGVGKTSFMVHKSIQLHKKIHRIWWRKHLFHKDLEEPLLYSNVPILNYKYYVPLTEDLILRKKRFAYKSIIAFSEASLVANSQDYKRKDLPTLNDDITEFLKLIRHELHGSYRSWFGIGKNIPNMIIETQNPNDLHFAFDRCIVQSIFLTKSMNIPFFKLVYCREIMLIPHTENIVDDDFKESITQNYRFLVPKSVFKKYDSYAYSFLTDNLDVYTDTLFIPKDIGKLQFEIPSFHEFDDISKSNKYLRKKGKQYIPLKLKTDKPKLKAKKKVSDVDNG